MVASCWTLQTLHFSQLGHLHWGVAAEKRKLEKASQPKAKAKGKAKPKAAPKPTENQEDWPEEWPEDDDDDEYDDANNDNADAESQELAEDEDM